MATVVHEPPKTERPRIHQGDGGWKRLVPVGGELPSVQDRSPQPARTGIWIGLATITMSFAAFTSALIVRQGSATDWRHFDIPAILYFNTLVLLASSVTLELSRREVAAFAGGATSRLTNPARWLYVTLGLGFTFVTGQYLAWLQLRSEGLYLATNPSSSFFYVFTAMHALHVLGGLGGLIYVIRKIHHSRLRRSTLDAASYYWHFMDVLWLYLLFLLWMRL